MKNTSIISRCSGILFFVTLICCFATVGCGQKSELSTTAIPEKVLFEIHSVGKFTSYPDVKVLKLRVFNSGKAEYDHFPPQGQEFYLQRRSLQLSEEDLNYVKHILENRSWEQVKPIYEPTERMLDAAVEVTLDINLSTGLRQIILKENHSNLVLDKKMNVYPSELLKLLKFAELIDERNYSPKGP